MEGDLRGRARVMRLNILDSVGMKAARRFGVRAVPTFIVVNGQGSVVDVQVGIPNRAHLSAQVNTLLTK